MQKLVTFVAMAALIFLFTPASHAQGTDEVQRLKKENELLKKEIELLKKETELLRRELELLKKETGSKTNGGDTKGAKAVTKATFNNVDYELVKCVRDPKKPRKVTFTISAECDTGDTDVPFTGSGGGFGPGPALTLTANGGEALKGGKTINSPPLKLKRGVAVNFQVIYDDVPEEITQLDTIRLSANANIQITFYNIKIASK